MNARLATALFAVVLLIAAAVPAAKYVDPLGGSDANDGSITAPWKTLQNIHNLADTVYISNSAVCYFGDATERNPVDVTLLPWGTGRPTITFSNATGNASIYLGSNPGAGHRVIMRNLILQPTAATPVIYPRFGAKTVDIENCVFQMSPDVPRTRWIHMRSNGGFLRFWSNLVYYANTDSSGFFVNNEEFGYTIDMRFNRFYDFYGANAAILYMGAANSQGIVAQNTAWGCRYFIRAVQPASSVTSINNIVEYKKSADNWWRDNQLFCDFTFSGDSAASTFSATVVQGPSNFTALTEAQIKFLNTNDVTAANFLRIDLGSVAERSDAAEVYSGFDLPAYAGWAQAIPEPLAVVILLPAVLALRRRAESRA